MSTINFIVLPKEDTKGKIKQIKSKVRQHKHSFFPFQFQVKGFSSQSEGDDKEDDSACSFWTFAATPSFFSLVSSLLSSRVWNRLQHRAVDRSQGGHAGGTEFQSASPCEQRPVSRLWPLMPPDTAILKKEEEKKHYMSHNAICLFV